jgi:hypothetical protein
MQSTYEYGVRLDDGARAAVWDQVIMARRLYNELIAVMRGIYDGMQAFTLECAGQEAAALMARIQELGGAFKAARAGLAGRSSNQRVYFRCLRKRLEKGEF